MRDHIAKIAAVAACVWVLASMPVIAKAAKLDFCSSHCQTAKVTNYSAAIVTKVKVKQPAGPNNRAQLEKTLSADKIPNDSFQVNTSLALPLSLQVQHHLGLHWGKGWQAQHGRP